MERAQSFLDNDTLIAPKKPHCQASRFPLRLFALELECCFVHFSSLLLENNLVVLLQKHGEEEQAKKLVRGELTMLNLNFCQAMER